MVIAVVLTLTVTSGCMWTPELSRVKNDIERQLPDARFEKEFALSLGPIALTFARLVTKLVPDASQASEYLRDVSRVQVAVYNTEALPPVSEVRMPDRLERMSDDGWETAVKVREDDGVVWVMYKIDGDTIRDLYVVVLNDEELVIVKARGQLERLVARALSETGGVPGIPRVNRDEQSAF
jgi:hypothetical protein